MAVEEIILKSPSLTGGISKQPAHVRFAHQVADATNVEFSIAEGASKRNGSEFLTTVTGLGTSDAYRLHDIVRDDIEKYILIYGGGILKVFESNGNATTVNITAAAQTYLDNGSPTSSQLRVTSIADYTFILNTTVALATKTAGADLDETTMPIQMVRTSASNATENAVFDVDVVAWDTRASGNNTTNPAPSLWANGSKLSDISFHRERLVLAGDEHVVFSQDDDLFNFYLGDATNIVDSDPIDVPLSSTQVTLIDFLALYRDTPLIFTKAGRQFEFDKPETLTPSTGSFTPSTAYKSQSVRPEQMGNMVYFASVGKNAAKIHEYFFDESQAANTAADLTKHIDGLLPLNIRSLAANTNNNALFVLPSVTPAASDLLVEGGDHDGDSLLLETGDTILLDHADSGGSDIFAYRQHWVGGRKEQSAWSKFSFDSSYQIADITVIDNDLYMLVKDNGLFTLEHFSIAKKQADTSWDYVVHLDRAQKLTGVYGSSKTTWTLPQADPTINRIVLGPAFNSNSGLEVTVTTSGTSVTTTTDVNYAAGEAYVGRAFTMTIEPTRPFVRDLNGHARLDAYMQYRKISVDHMDTGEYSIKAAQPLRANRTKAFDEGSDGLEARGIHTAWFSGNADDLTLTIENATAKPSIITALEYLMNYVPRSG